MPSYFDSRKLEYSVSGSWVDISEYLLIDNIPFFWGINGQTPVDRVAATGQLDFLLINDDNLFTLGHVSCLPGWKRGASVRISYTFQGTRRVKFKGRVERVLTSAKDHGDKVARVTVLDWMNVSATHPIILPSIKTNQRIGDAATTLLDGMTIKPLDTSFAVGEDVFPSTFDNLGSKPNARTELSKLAASEICYVYLKSGETLVVESRSTRSVSSEVTKIPKLKSMLGRLKKEDGYFLMTESSKKLVLDGNYTVSFEDNAIDSLISDGSNLINRIVMVDYPRNISPDIEVLYALSDDIYLDAGATKSFSVDYQNPNGTSERISADPDTMIVPVITTDYGMYSQPDGNGSDVSIYLGLSVAYGSNGAEYSVTNNWIQGAWVHKVQFRGYPIYNSNSVRYVAEDAASIEEHGYKTLTFEQKYQASTDTAQTYADNLLSIEKQPRRILERIDFIANVSDDLMAAFLYYDMGSLVYIKFTDFAVDGYYYIHKIVCKEHNGIMYFSWYVVDSPKNFAEE